MLSATNGSGRESFAPSLLSAMARSREEGKGDLCTARTGRERSRKSATHHRRPRSFERHEKGVQGQTTFYSIKLSHCVLCRLTLWRAVSITIYVHGNSKRMIHFNIFIEKYLVSL
jgi:hypothetical protein